MPKDIEMVEVEPGVMVTRQESLERELDQAEREKESGGFWFALMGFVIVLPFFLLMMR